MAMIIAIPKERRAGETRVAATPETVKKFKGLGLDVIVEKDAGDIIAGAPYVANAKVTGVVDGEARGPKIRVFKKKRRKGFRKTRGHRSVFVRVRITNIEA